MENLPRGGSGGIIQLSPSVVALEQTLDTSISSSTEITLNSKTSIIRFYATGQDVWLKWGTADVTSSNFDEVIPVGQIVDLVVPKSISAVNLIQRAATAQIVVIEK